MHSNDKFGRIIGMIVFLAGIGVLGIVFAVAYSFFSSDAASIRFSGVGDAAPSVQVGESAVQLLARIGSLIVMAVVGSLISGKGIQLYFTSGKDVSRD